MEKLLGRKMESRKEIKRKKVLRERFRESERDLRRERRRYKIIREKENGKKVRENLRESEINEF